MKAAKHHASFRGRFRVKDGISRVHFVGIVGLPVFERRLLADSVDVFGGSGKTLQSTPEIGRHEIWIGPENGAGKASGENLDRV